jgi:hypothetical protein
LTHPWFPTIITDESVIIERQTEVQGMKTNLWFTADIIREGLTQFGRFNAEYSPWTIVIPAVFALTALLLSYFCYWKPGRRTSGYLKAWMAVIYFFAGLQIVIASKELGSFLGVFGAVVLWSYIVFLVFDIRRNKTVFEFDLTEHKAIKIFGLTLMGIGIVGYPVVETLTGLAWPEMAIFGQECPTTNFLIGLLLTAYPRINRPFLGTVSVVSIISGSSMVYFGLYVDVFYIIAGISGLTAVILTRRTEKAVSA